MLKNIKLLQKEDGLQLSLSASTGKSCVLDIKSLSEKFGPIVGQAIVDWADENAQGLEVGEHSTSTNSERDSILKEINEGIKSVQWKNNGDMFFQATVSKETYHKIVVQN